MFPGYAVQIAVPQATAEAAVAAPCVIRRDHDLAARIHIRVVHIQLERAHVALFHKREAVNMNG